MATLTVAVSCGICTNGADHGLRSVLAIVSDCEIVYVGGDGHYIRAPRCCVRLSSSRCRSQVGEFAPYHLYHTHHIHQVG